MNVKLRYTGRGHTMIRKFGNDLKVKENTIVTVFESEVNDLLRNWFVLVWGANLQLIQNTILEIKENIDRNEREFERLEMDINQSAKKRIMELKKPYSEKTEIFKNRLKELEKELELAQKDKIEINRDTEKQIRDLQEKLKQDKVEEKTQAGKIKALRDKIK